MSDIIADLQSLRPRRITTDRAAAEIARLRMEVIGEKKIADMAMDGCDEKDNEIARLRADKARLREILQRIVTYYVGEARPEAVFKLDNARAALEATR